MSSIGALAARPWDPATPALCSRPEGRGNAKPSRGKGTTEGYSFGRLEGGRSAVITFCGARGRSRVRPPGSSLVRKLRSTNWPKI